MHSIYLETWIFWQTNSERQLSRDLLGDFWKKEGETYGNRECTDPKASVGVQVRAHAPSMRITQSQTFLLSQTSKNRSNNNWLGFSYVSVVIECDCCACRAHHTIIHGRLKQFSIPDTAISVKCYKLFDVLSFTILNDSFSKESRLL